MKGVSKCIKDAEHFYHNKARLITLNIPYKVLTGTTVLIELHISHSSNFNTSLFG